jgi:hypothetical protein
MGYKSEVEGLLHHELRSTDVTIRLGKNRNKLFQKQAMMKMDGTPAEMGIKSMTGARVRELENVTGDDSHFM